MPRSDYVSLVVDGRRLGSWLEYRIESSLLTPADAWRMTVRVANPDTRDLLRDILKPRKHVQLFVGGEDVGSGRPLEQNRYLQMTGITSARETTGERGQGTEFTVSGKDSASLLLDDNIDPSIVVAAGTRFTDLVRTVVGPWAGEPWNMSVVADHSASRDILTARSTARSVHEVRRGQARSHGIQAPLYSRRVRTTAETTGQPIDTVAGGSVDSTARTGAANGLLQPDIERLTVREAQPRVGESSWEFLERHARRLRLMMWMTPDGRLVVGSPWYDQPALYRICRRYRSNPQDPNEALSGREILNGDEEVSEVVVYGRTRGNDVTRASVVGRATATDWDGPRRVLRIQDNSVRTQAQADARAQRALALAKMRAHVLEYTMPHHGQGNFLYAIDTVAYVDDEVCGVRGEYYVTDRVFMKSRQQGTTTHLTLVPKGSIVL